MKTQTDGTKKIVLDLKAACASQYRLQLLSKMMKFQVKKQSIRQSSVPSVLLNEITKRMML